MKPIGQIQVGDAAKTKECFAVEIPGTNGKLVEYVHAERVRAEGSFVTFSNGDVFSPDLVAIYAAHRLDSVYPCLKTDGKCKHLSDDESDDE